MPPFSQLSARPAGGGTYPALSIRRPDRTGLENRRRRSRDTSRRWDDATGRRHALEARAPTTSMDDALRAGVAIYNDGYYHAAHDAWEDRWLELEEDTDDERLLHGLIQFTAAVYHARERNWDGAVGLAESASEYLEDLPAEYREVDLPPVRAYLEALESDPELIERRRPIALVHHGDGPTVADLEFGPTAIAAVVLAEELGYDEKPIEQARGYARDDLEAGDDGSRFITLLFDFVREDDHRGIVYQRLTGHVERRNAREEDVEGLF
ncbi:hypothetical protein AArcMg_0156 [Natrarchaeobaculum sulfurireducens]|uniref:DUF309 domain-containing protein n=1 Tax=Natrarchaeobaculum sulfurireducens TaxID=2044521 RepID=A0A346PKZ0_9EURY|nr:hypothetical protein AArcMg_0156 [Natrarchaeobaculum sulfurireducens]